jgi:hypothetical protein
MAASGRAAALWGWEVLADAGFAHCRALFSADQAKIFSAAVEHALDVPELTPATAPAHAFAEFPRQPALWSLLDTPGLLECLSREMRTRPVLLPGVDTIAVNASETKWHRDASYDELPGACEPGSVARYRVTRLITYPGLAGEEPNDFLVYPGSPSDDRPTDDMLRRGGVRLTLEPGDAVLFDARSWHAGAPPNGVKRLIVLTFGSDDALTAQTLEHEYRNMRAAGVDPAPPAEFHELLASAGLLALW